jgi:hypothetical protein
MPSTYTLNNGIELIGTGEQSGTWGDTTNTNLGLLDVALDGQVTVALASAGSSGSPNSLPISDGTASNGRNRMVVFSDSGDLGATAYVQLTPNDAEKIIYIRNSLSGSRSVILFQGTYNASNDYEVPAGTTAVVYFDGAGAGAVAANVFNNAYFDGLRLGSVSVTAILDEDNMASDSAAALATQQSIKAYVDAQVGTVDTLAEILAIGNTTGATDIAVDSAQKVQFRDAAIYINSSVDGQLDIVADTEIQIAATTVDLNGNLDVSGTLGVTGVLTATSLDISGDIDVDGTTNLDVVDIDGATQIDATVTVGVDDTGYDVKFFGATAGKYMLWDESADTLEVSGTVVAGAGTALLPSITTTGDLNTGMWFPAADTIAFSEGGVEALRIDTSGNVLVGKTAQSVDTVGGEILSTGIGQFTVNGNFAGRFTRQTSDGDIVVFRKGTGTVASIGISQSGSVPYIGGTDTGICFNSATNGVLPADTSNPTAVQIDAAKDLGFSTIRWRDLYLSGGIQGAAAGSIVINEAGLDVDFRVESDTNANALIVDGATGNIGFSLASTPYGSATTEGLFYTAGAGFDIASNTNTLRVNRNSTGGNDRVNIELQNNGTTRAEFGSLGAENGFYLSDSTKAIISGYSDEVVINETGADTNFRVESDNETHALFVDAGNDAVHIGGSTDVDDHPLVVHANTNANAIAIRGRSDDIGEITFYENDATTKLGGLQYRSTFTRLDNRINGATLDFATGAALTESASFSSTQNIFNDGGVDMDFRVESNSNANMLFVDAGNDRVGIATGSPSYRFDQIGTLALRNGSIMLGRDAGTTTGGIHFYNPSTNTNQLRIYDDPGLWGGTSGANNTQIQIYDGSVYSLLLDGASGVSFDAGSNYLDDYEEGTWTVTSPTVTFTDTSGYYIKIGKKVFVEAQFTIPSTASGVQFYIDTLPFVAEPVGFGGLSIRYTNNSTVITFHVNGGGTRIGGYNLDGNATSLASVSTHRFDIFGQYTVQ